MSARHVYMYETLSTSTRHRLCLQDTVYVYETCLRLGDNVYVYETLSAFTRLPCTNSLSTARTLERLGTRRIGAPPWTETNRQQNEVCFVCKFMCLLYSCFVLHLWCPA
uniref:BAH domain-containing protein n=1 Tax=Steinernema glaseri TaxID=37863 RepID=A0A1I7ZIV8_9BILA